MKWSCIVMRHMALCGLFVLVCIVLACQGEDKVAIPEEGSVLSVDSVEIHYQVYGSAEKTLVFLHCWSCDESYWRNQVGPFSRDYKVVTIDLAGHGQSGTNREAWTVEAFGRDVVAVVNYLELDNVVLVGHSMGAVVIIETAKMIPDKVRAIIGVDMYQDFSLEFTDAQVDSFVDNFERNFKEYTFDYVLALFPAASDSAVVEPIAEDMASAPPEIAVEALRNTVLYDYKKALADFDIPIYAINAERFPTNVEANKEIAGHFEIGFISETGHFPQLEKPEVFNEILRSMLEKIW